MCCLWNDGNVRNNNTRKSPDDLKVGENHFYYVRLGFYIHRHEFPFDAMILDLYLSTLDLKMARNLYFNHSFVSDTKFNSFSIYKYILLHD